MVVLETVVKMTVKSQLELQHQYLHELNFKFDAEVVGV